jgi:hypothetical protein
MPPPAAAEVAVAQFVVLADAGALLLAEVVAEELLVAEGVLAGVELLDELELLQAAASKVNPTAAALATIAFEARKVKPSHAVPRDTGAGVSILARQVRILANHSERKVAALRIAAVRLVAICDCGLGHSRSARARSSRNVHVVGRWAA